MSDTQSIIAQVKSGQGPLGVLLYDQASAENLRVTVKNIRDVSDKLNDPKSTFGQLITNDNLAKDMQSTLRKVDRAMDGLGDQGPITAVGVAASALF
jgi:phospholipid/cholesterol/gamma-HCH transport system substrate-binding protein